MAYPSSADFDGDDSVVPQGTGEKGVTDRWWKTMVDGKDVKMMQGNGEIRVEMKKVVSLNVRVNGKWVVLEDELRKQVGPLFDPKNTETSTGCSSEVVLFREPGLQLWVNSSNVCFDYTPSVKKRLRIFRPKP